MIGFSFGAGRSAKVSGFDPATLSLTGWWRANSTTDYDNGGGSGIWLPTASAGSSGSNGNLTEATNYPAEATVNGHTAPDFDGTNDRLANANNTSTFLSTTAYTVWVLFEADTAASAGANPWADPGLVTDTTLSSSWTISYASVTGTPSVRVAHFDTGTVTRTVAASTGAKHLAMVRFNGSTLGLTVDSGAESSVAAGTLSSIAHVFAVGKNYDASLFFDGRIIEVMTAQSDLSAQHSNVKGYVNTRYGLSL